MEMVRVRVAVVFDPTLGWHSPLPTYFEVPGSYLPVIEGKIEEGGILRGVSPTDPDVATVTREVFTDRDDLNEEMTAVDTSKVSKKYRKSKRWGKAKEELDEVVKPLSPVPEPPVPFAAAGKPASVGTSVDGT